MEKSQCGDKQIPTPPPGMSQFPWCSRGRRDNPDKKQLKQANLIARLIAANIEWAHTIIHLCGPVNLGRKDFKFKFPT